MPGRPTGRPGATTGTPQSPAATGDRCPRGRVRRDLGERAPGEHHRVAGGRIVRDAGHLPPRRSAASLDSPSAEGRGRPRRPDTADHHGSACRRTPRAARPDRGPAAGVPPIAAPTVTTSAAPIADSAAPLRRGAAPSKESPCRPQAEAAVDHRPCTARGRGPRRPGAPRGAVPPLGQSLRARQPGQHPQARRGGRGERGKPGAGPAP